MTDTPLLETTAKEVDGALNVYEGEFPQDMLGTVYIVYQIGSVNSDGLPYPEHLPDGSFNHEYGSAIMSGDGMVMKLDLTSTPTIRTRIMKTPCYYADWHTREETKESHEDFGGLRFRNFGIARMSLVLGSRNPLNTAVTPARFGSDTPVLIAAYDIGRPYVLDPVTLELKTVIGKNTEWMTGTPARVPWPFELFESTAHPCYDPRTKELFSVNYSRMEKAVIIAERTIHHLKHNHDIFKEKLLGIMEKHEKSANLVAARGRVVQFFSNLDEELASVPPPRPGFLGRLGASLKDLLA
ncbi:MAG: carotenoid oxygenase family protein, partial [Bacteroidetes bacterium]|nr:carotenoid oxygenase family protein [Bacteroidota bacterium]